MATQMTFDNLAQNILAVHHSARNYAKNAVNQALTIRNWLIGFYIVEYEQKGCDRAQYGTQLLKNLESKLNTKGLNNTLLKNSRKFYLLYPEVKTIIPNDQSKLLDKLLPKSPTPSDFLMVEYALSGIDNQLFATTYMLQLPHKEQLMEFMQKQLAEMQ